MGDIMVKVSVIVPVYNAESFLKDCLESLIHQTLQDIEIICIDDKSQDGSLDILYGYQKKDSRIKVICNETNRGAAEARNRGMAVARGNYTQFVDADDYLAPEALEKLYSMAETHHLDMCYLGMQFHVPSNEEDSVSQNRISGEYPGVFSGKELLRRFTENGEFFLYLWSVFYRSAFIKKHELGYKKLRIGEGGDFILRALCLAERAAVCKELFYHYRLNEGSVTHGANAKRELLLGQIVQYADVLRYFSTHENAEELDAFFDYQYRKMAGGIQNLSQREKEEIESRLETRFEKHIFGMLQQKNDVYGIRFDEEILHRIQEKDAVIVYGAGHGSKEVIELLQQYKIEILGFAVTRREKDRTSVFGHHIYEIEELLSYNNNSIVLVAANKKFNHEIQGTLDQYGFKDYIFLHVEI